MNDAQLANSQKRWRERTVETGGKQETGDSDGPEGGQQKWTEEQQDERRESQRVRYLISQHSPMQKDQLQHDSHMWLEWARSKEVEERVCILYFPATLFYNF